MISEFKDFAVKGNLADMAIGLVMGAAFGKVAEAFIQGMFMPLVSLITGGVDFNSLKYTITPGSDDVKDAAGVVVTKAVAEVAIKYGTFISICIEFVLIAFVMFLVVKAINKAKTPPPPAPPAGPTADQVLLAEIRDALKK